LFTREGRITLGTVLGKFFCSSASLASGIGLGREGPAVQVGAGIASVLGRSAKLSKEKVKALVPVGAGRGV
jgi:CIC family chloride channel protein